MFAQSRRQQFSAMSVVLFSTDLLWRSRPAHYRKVLGPGSRRRPEGGAGHVARSLVPRPMNTFTSILVDIDATAAVQPALERAAEVARKCGAPLRVVDVMSPPAEARRALREDLEDELMARRREKLARIAYGLRDVVAETDILAGTPADALIEDVERFGHDLLVRSHARDIAARGPKPFWSR